MAEQLMIESLAEHGVVAEDLVPALMTTHTVKNPEYDPKAAKEAEAEDESGQGEREDESGEGEREWDSHSEQDAPPPYEPSPLPNLPTESTSVTEKTGEITPRKSTTPLPALDKSRPKSINPFGDDSDEDEAPVTAKALHTKSTSPSRSPQPRRKSTNPFGSDDEEDGLPSFASSSRPSVVARKSTERMPSFDFGDDEGDIGRPSSPAPEDILKVASPRPRTDSTAEEASEDWSREKDADPERTPTKEHPKLPDPEKSGPNGDDKEDDEEEPPSLPSLPGVSTSLTTADENVVLDIRWTVVSSQSVALVPS